ncbi:ABC transporter substrate-binding protein [Massilia antarctica]|uniref:ABC transporter substrate-binding protein n=1 Tax=Massilia antarctica TaxID=2765360 RepID=UPI0006BD4D92|nr:ABC transporter substrate-binding protein [Massilia sp. H27-R4]CUI08701.1 Branched-chain amino acid ABC transporter, amino acid-binding protein (TC 3.A.1.4.1) [Janthinobacterium sp. CG23_2]CUU32487.1 Branched-chain amino acid ABC transporter, amino acid-binding protein (TC 3.A.1.4.1) [Janthinobacterium sp. CG23_2]
MKSCIRALWLAMSVCLSLSAARAGAAEQIVVGHAIDLSGPNGSIGRDYVAGITTYFDSINVKGGINGKKIVYTVRDDHGVAAESARLAGTLIQQDRANYLLGAIGAESTQAILAAPAFADSRHVLFAPLTDAFPAPRGRVIFWRPSMERECQFILAYFDKLGLKKIGIVLQDTPHNQKTYQMVAEEVRKRGMTLVGTARVSANIEADAKQLSASGAKVVLMIADTIGASQFLKAFRKHDASTFVAGTSLINLATLSEIAGARATEWTVFSQVVPNPGSTASRLQSEHIDMMKKFRDEPVSAITLEGFAVAKTLVKVIQMEAAGRGGLQTMAASRTPIDIGGMTILSADRKSTMSEFVDIALFKRDGRLMY